MGVLPAGVPESRQVINLPLFSSSHAYVHLFIKCSAAVFLLWYWRILFEFRNCRIHLDQWLPVGTKTSVCGMEPTRVFQAASQDSAALRSLVDDLRSARDAYVAARGAGRLLKYHGMMVVSLNEGMGAAEMLAQASQIESSDVRAQLVASAAKHGQESERLQTAAAEAYGKTLPVVVQ